MEREAVGPEGLAVAARRVAGVASAALAAVAVVFMLASTLKSGWNSDTWFLLETGRTVVESGIPHENPWSIDPSLGIVVQQWGHAAILYLVYAAGGALACDAFASVLAAAACGLFLLCVSEHAGRPLRSMGAGRALRLSACFLVGLYPWINTRPQLWTLICALATMCVCERCRRRGTRRGLLAVPLIMVAQMQLQMAMAWLLPFVCACYALPSTVGELRALAGPEGRHEWAHAHAKFLVAAAAMVVVMPVNPYGVAGMLYLFKSFDAAGYKDVILEMKCLPESGAENIAYFGIVQGALMFALPLALAWRRGRGRADSTAMAAACAAAMVAQIRSGWLPLLASAALWGEASAGEGANKGRTPWSGTVAVAACGAAALACVLTGFLGDGQAGWEDYPRDLAPVLEEIVSEGGSRQDHVLCSDMPIYNYMEWSGWKVDVDARPEIWEPAITGDAEHRYRDYVDALGFGCEDADEAAWALKSYLERNGDEWVIAQRDVKQKSGAHGEGYDQEFYDSLAFLEKRYENGMFALYRVKGARG